MWWVSLPGMKGAPWVWGSSLLLRLYSGKLKVSPGRANSTNSRPLRSSIEWTTHGRSGNSPSRSAWSGTHTRTTK
ncbi:uncharacterized protein BJ171DRAFT_499385 [Polychytrium aggregatum]|uniref:uncharacterized protein n=1 Tax=Polychytrium aggregatum TaxID=110093 RepID=UPI0022FEA46D|nr:uncharacterized protein BJ171DRAFT_499385 [Polychytrium aggregatum]KAI9205706.1 hypothetical protein BJ171DRAFT_499385 [Polychytrium aggregatum]